jgi:hypothetical protein
MTKGNLIALALALPLLLGAVAPSAASALESGLYNGGGKTILHIQAPDRPGIKKMSLNGAAPVLSAGDVTVVCIPSEPGTWTSYDVWNAVTCEPVSTSTVIR